MNHLRDAVLEFLHALIQERPFLTPELIPRLKTDEFVRRVQDVVRDRLPEGGSVMQDVWDLVIQDHWRYRTDEAFLTISQNKIAAHLLYAFLLYFTHHRPDFLRVEVMSEYYLTHIWYFPASIAIMARLGYQLTLARTAFNHDFGVSRLDIVDTIVRILVLEQELELVLWAARRAVRHGIRIPLYVILDEKRRQHHSLEGFWYAVRYHPSVRLISPIGHFSSHHDWTGTTAANVAPTSHMAAISHTSPPAPLVPAAFPTTTSSHMPYRWMCPYCGTVHSYAESTCRVCHAESFLITGSSVGAGVDSSRRIELDEPVVQRRYSAMVECPRCTFPISPGEDCRMCRNYIIGRVANRTLFNPGRRF